MCVCGHVPMGVHICLYVGYMGIHAFRWIYVCEPRYGWVCIRVDVGLSNVSNMGLC